MDNEKIYSSKKELLEFLGIKESYLYPDFSTKYREIQKPKKKGGFRTIKPPNFNLKNLQRKILDKILVKSPQLECVYGLSKDKSILDNAKLHQKNVSAQLLNLDIKNFFPCISNKKVCEVFKKIGFNKENSLVLTKLCTVEKSLPQGAPTSPYLASMVCLKLDKEIYSFCKRRKFIYTRYFDDISISGENISPKHISNLERIVTRHGFICNEEKKEFFDFNSIKIINSILISNSGLFVTDNYKEEIKNIYQTFLSEKTIQNKRVFRGKFGFYLHINKKEALDFLKDLKKKTL